ncbi:hypothetical protein [Neomegalonema sp.]|uniref:hypothetical protein n=1 Tax=Neomegalonema sp. TaxID=2039713 RepID=UPI00262C01ED|nr:hypothetical protein [Neomegalonema sp.]MDD2869459.1 hypothetical protein [Neomegalonema sp.]
MRACVTIWSLGALLAGCVASEPMRVVGSETIDVDYHLAALPWGEGGHMLFFTRALEEGGELKLCGAYGVANARRPTEERARAVAEAALLSLGPTQVADGLGFMAPHDGSRDPLGQPARCARTGLDWRPEFAGARPQVRLREGAL